MAARLCLDCDTPCTGTRCPDCTTRRRPPARQRAQANTARDTRRGTTAQRGYGAEHQRSAAQLKACMSDGEPCCRCGQPMYRWQLELDRNDLRGIDADHRDDARARDGYPPDALAHRLCNRAAAGRAGRRAP